MNEDGSEHDRFQRWLMRMDEALEELMSGLSERERAGLDFTIASLDRMEALLSSRHASGDDARANGDPRFFDGCARYVGETLRRELGGTWEIVLDDPSNVHYRRPRVVGMRNAMPPVCPIQWIFTAIQRQRGDFMRSIVRNYGAG